MNRPLRILEVQKGYFELWPPEGEGDYELGYFDLDGDKYLFSPTAVFSQWSVDANDLRRIAQKLDDLDKALDVDATRGE